LIVGRRLLCRCLRTDRRRGQAPEQGDDKEDRQRSAARHHDLLRIVNAAAEQRTAIALTATINVPADKCLWPPEEARR
jgi:hypothetical protein